MVQNYIVVALRRLVRNPVTATINVAGLAIGFAAVTLIGLYVQYELSYNAWLADADRIYKAEFTETEPGHAPILSAMTPAPLAAALEKDFAGVEVATRLKTQRVTVAQGNRRFTEEVYAADPDFFSVFDLATLEGSREAALADDRAVAISATAARKYFGANSPLGEVLTFGDGFDKTVVAVLKDTPQNSHLKIEFLLRATPAGTGLVSFRESWGSDQVHTYLKARPGFDTHILEREGRAFAERNITLDWTQLPPADLHHYNLVRVTDIHLLSNKDNHESATSNISIVATFMIVALLVLALAVINFANLSTAQALQWVREVSLRKLLGATRAQIAGQFLGEAMLMSVFALIVGLTVVEFSLPPFASFVGKGLTLAPLAEPGMTALIAGLALLAGLCGGFYPAFVLSGLRLSQTLKANKSGFEGAPRLRSLLVVLQFAVSIALIAATSIIYRQTVYVHAADLGFDPNGKVLVPVWEQAVRPVAPALMDALKDVPGVRAVASTTAPLPGAPHGLGVFTPANSSRDEAKSITRIQVDPTFLPMMGQAALAGRVFDAARTTDFVPEATGIARGVVVNEAAVKLLGYENAETAVGALLTMAGRSGDTPVQIVGIVPDAHYGSLHKAVQPVVFLGSQSPLYYLVLDIGGSDAASTMARVDTVWQALVPGVPMGATHLSDAYEALYLDEERQATIFTAFSLFAVFVACLGLYGLSVFTAERRTKEIGIRKVVGASVSDIVMLLTWQFSKLVLIAVPIGVAMSAFGTGWWLEGFAYRLSLLANSWVFVLASAAAFAIAWATVGAQAARVARLNPIRALRYE